MKRIWIVGLFILALFSCITGCGKKEYRVDYSGSKAVFLDAKDSYPVGSTVELKVFLATDTVYRLLVDGEEADQQVSEDGGELIFTFVMPEHDVVLEYSTKNLMVDLPDTEGELLFDYYWSPVAVVGEVSYDEMTLNRGNDGRLYLNAYTGNVSDGSVVSHSAFSVPEEALMRVMEVVETSHMAEWNEVGGPGLEGAIAVVRFPDAKGEMIRASTECMPENGEAAMDRIRQILWEYRTEDRLVQ